MPHNSEQEPRSENPGIYGWSNSEPDVRFSMPPTSETRVSFEAVFEGLKPFTERLQTDRIENTYASDDERWQVEVGCVRKRIVWGSDCMFEQSEVAVTVVDGNVTTMLGVKTGGDCYLSLDKGECERLDLVVGLVAGCVLKKSGEQESEWLKEAYALARLGVNRDRSHKDGDDRSGKTESKAANNPIATRINMLVGSVPHPVAQTILYNVNGMFGGTRVQASWKTANLVREKNTMLSLVEERKLKVTTADRVAYEYEQTSDGAESLSVHGRRQAFDSGEGEVVSVLSEEGDGNDDPGTRSPTDSDLSYMAACVRNAIQNEDFLI